MLVFNSSQLKEADVFTMLHEPVSSIDLMERAAKKCTDFILQKYLNQETGFVVFCGPGNNGGDGLAIARMLKIEGKDIRVFLMGEKFSEDNSTNQKRLKEIGVSFENHSEISAVNFKDSVIIDAIFGIGLSRVPDGIFKTAILEINKSECDRISIDVPSGMLENEQKDLKVIVKADETLTFQFPKLNFFLADSGPFAGDFSVLDIQLHPDGYLKQKPTAVYLSVEMIKPYFSNRERFSHKGTYGHACLIGGQFGKIGSMVLASMACLRSGAGLTTVVLPHCGYDIMQTSVPEAMVRISEGDKFHLSINIGDIDYDAIGIGPGLGTEKDTADAFKLLIQNTNVSMVIDADALNILAENKTWLAFLPAGSILTPHPGEFERLAGRWNSSYEMIRMQRDFSLKYNCYVILKGAYSSITTPNGNLYFNSTGNPGMAKGGSGDALTGILTALSARGFSSMETALAGTFIHGMAADLAVKEISEESMITRDIIDRLSEAFSILKN